MKKMEGNQIISITGIKPHMIVRTLIDILMEICLWLFPFSLIGSSTLSQMCASVAAVYIDKKKQNQKLDPNSFIHLLIQSEPL